MEILFIGLSKYGDPFCDDWHADLRYTVKYLRRQGLTAGLISPSQVDNGSALISQVKALEPRLCFFDANPENFEQVFETIDLLKSRCPNFRIVAGGPATVPATDTLCHHPNIDYIIKGERELTLLEIINRMRDQRKVEDTPGLSGKGFDNPMRTPLQNLDVLDEMALDDIDTQIRRRSRSKRVGFIVTSRGCYGTCTFCSVPVVYRLPPGRPWRGKSPTVVVNEIEQLCRAYGIRSFVFEDDDYLGPGRAGRERAAAIACELLCRKLRIDYCVACRLNDLDRSTLLLMKESGLSKLAMSVESTSQRALNLFKKGLRAEEIYPALAMLEELKIETEVNLIFFDPYMTLDEVNGNLRLLHDIKDSAYVRYSNSFAFNELKPFAWTPISKILSEDQVLDEVAHTCRYKDKRVQVLVDLVNSFRRRLSLSFKTQLLFAGLNDAASLRANEGAYFFGLCLAQAFRNWLNLQVVPTLVEEACGSLRGGLGDDENLLDFLQTRFDTEAERINSLSDACVGEILDQARPSLEDGSLASHRMGFPGLVDERAYRH
jgi:radical SAM superfamily enzyme YgiQ (UPF0313 family)